MMQYLDKYEKDTLKAFNQLSDNEQALVKQRADSEKADPLVAWILWLFLGMWGAHRFYLKRSNAVLMLALTVIGYLTLFLLFGFLILLITWIWWIVDAFHVNDYLKKNRLDALYNSIIFITGKSPEVLCGNEFNSNYQQPTTNQSTEDAQPVIEDNQPTTTDQQSMNLIKKLNNRNLKNKDNNNSSQNDDDYTDFSHPQK